MSACGLVGMKRLDCGHCGKIRLHEAMLGFAKCVTCGLGRVDADHISSESEHIDWKDPVL